MTNSKYLKIYINFLKKFSSVKKPLKLVLDCSNSTTGFVLKKLKVPNSKFIILNSRVDGNFPAHGPNPLQKGAVAEAKKSVIKNKADFGAVFDGDGDRAVFIDNKGKRVSPHVVAMLFFKNHKPPYVADIYTYYLLKLAGYPKIKKVIPSLVGTKFIKENMKKKKASVGVEYSAHYYFKNFFYSDSGVLGIIKAMNVLSQESRKLSSLVSELPVVYFEQFNIKRKAPLKKYISEFKKKFSKAKVSRLDGVTFEEKGWVLNIRESHTEPLFRIFIAARSQKDFKKAKKLTRQIAD